MSKDQDQSNFDDGVFLDPVLSEDPFELDFNDSKAIKKQHRAISRRQTRHRIEDHFERKALKAQQEEWELDFDY